MSKRDEYGELMEIIRSTTGCEETKLRIVENLKTMRGVHVYFPVCPRQPGITLAHDLIASKTSKHLSIQRIRNALNCSYSKARSLWVEANELQRTQNRA
jgi:hypothetical protein